LAIYVEYPVEQTVVRVSWRQADGEQQSDWNAHHPRQDAEEGVCQDLNTFKDANDSASVTVVQEQLLFNLKYVTIVTIQFNSKVIYTAPLLSKFH